MIVLRAGFVLAILVATFGCSKKDDSASGGKASGGGASASGLAWTPVGYDAMSAACKKALACCEEIAKTEGAKSAEDFNGKCSGPALWKDNDCEMDLKARASSFEAANQPVPAACK